MKRPPPGIFQEEFSMGGPKAKAYTASGEFRPPLKGEYYLSGAIVTVYLALVDLSQAYWIAVPVELVPCPHCVGSGKVAK